MSAVRSLRWPRPLRFLARAAVLSALLAHGGCSSLPTSGPSNALARMDPANPASLPYAMVKVTPEVENILDRNSVRIGRVFVDRRGPAEIRFGIGDTVSVTIFEAAAGGLFIPADAGVRPGNYVTLPNQPVDTQGNITVTNNADNLDFGLVGCRRSVPHLQRLLGHLETALKDLERAVGV